MSEHVESERVPDLSVDPLSVLRMRRSTKWSFYPDDVVPLPIAEMDFALADPIADVLREAIDRSDTGYASPVPELGESLSDFAAARWHWDIDPAQVTPVLDVGVGVVEVLRVLSSGGGTVVISPPVYPPFYHWVDEIDGRLREVPLARTDHGWRLDLPASNGRSPTDRRPTCCVIRTIRWAASTMPKSLRLLSSWPRDTASPWSATRSTRR